MTGKHPRRGMRLTCNWLRRALSLMKAASSWRTLSLSWAFLRSTRSTSWRPSHSCLAAVRSAMYDELISEALRCDGCENICCLKKGTRFKERKKTAFTRRGREQCLSTLSWRPSAVMRARASTD